MTVAATRAPSPRPLSAAARTRLVWLRVHRWLGLAGLAALFLIALTGSAITYPAAYERLVHAERFPDGPGTALAPSALAKRARAALSPEARLAGLLYGDGPRPNVMAGSEVVAPAALGLGPPQRAKVWLDPRNGKVLSTSDGGPDMIWAAYATHGDLLLGRWAIVTAGLALIISSISGFYLWWPGIRRAWKALHWRKQFTRNMNLHRISGAVMAVILLIEAITGIFVAYPAAITAWIDGDTPGAGAEEGPPPSRPMARPARNIDEVLATAKASLPGQQLQSIWLPTEGDPRWTVNFASPAGLRAVSVDDASAGVSVSPIVKPTRGERLTQTVMRIHFGDYGAVYRFVIFLSGLVLALLSVTGIWLWLQGRKRSIR